jgi:hypothetical protein
VSIIRSVMTRVRSVPSDSSWVARLYGVPLTRSMT